MSRKSFTLIEVLLSLLIISLSIGIVFMIYPTLFEGVRISSQKVLAWEDIKYQIELLKNTPFKNLYAKSYDPENQAPVANTFHTSNVPRSRGVYYIEQVYADLNGDGNFDEICDDLLKIEVLICLKVGRRLLGEDSNLNGILEKEEDKNADGKISSVLSLNAFVIKPDKK